MNHFADLTFLALCVTYRFLLVFDCACLPTLTALVQNADPLRTTFANSYESVVVPSRVNNDTRLTPGLTYEKK